MKKIAVLGPVPRDTIITYKNETIHKYGCVTHPAIALSRLMEDRGRVEVISHIHQKDKEAVKDLFSEFQNVNLQGIDADQDRGTVIELRFTDQNNRLEKQTAFMNPILPQDVEPFLDSNVFIFVPITDFEISLSTLRHIKENSKGLIIFDAHGPTTSLNINGTRERKFWVDRDEWLPYIDVLKMNLEESQCCWFKNEYSQEEMGKYNEEDTSHLADFAEHVLDNGVSVLYVTLDARGCVCYTRQNGKTQKKFIKSVPVEEVVDTTGCGDSFAGGLGYGFAFHNDPVKAAQYANTLGALRTQGKTYEVFKNLEETEAIMAENYS
ncbi:carbohydrate kinase family protein [Antarcticibacterium flavum]|uniref:Carbohydrate kinase family protein n=1 Tax=Antarcticibacterium flavum TaxID=2058175 RepID=A0A5B7X2Q6_9FLAO|nr:MULTISPECIES: carbohydrate kinase family protein [Antarcticibacterium]MCM4160552.1 carbohydrate kinase family protein [Antarcticibacterium sp. W02-3]QCY69786.1 carbohydrate kinase family protein [Antarcticibacterium flavum]